MKPALFDPLHLDVAAFARQAGELQGEWPLSALPRLTESTAPAAGGAQPEPVRWHVHGEAQARRGADPLVRLHLQADAGVWLQCQRCLKPMHEALRLERTFRFVPTEEQAEVEDADSEEDLLTFARSLDLKSLLEDELILALPLVPRHAVCPDPLPMPADEGEAAALPADSPFAQLAVLKRSKPSH